MVNLNERICNECMIPMDWIKDGREFKDSEDLKPSKMEQFRNYKYDSEKGFYYFQCSKCRTIGAKASHHCSECDRPTPDVYNHLVHFHGFDIKQWKDIEAPRWRRRNYFDNAHDLK